MTGITAGRSSREARRAARLFPEDRSTPTRSSADGDGGDRATSSSSPTASSRSIADRSASLRKVGLPQQADDFRGPTQGHLDRCSCLLHTAIPVYFTSSPGSPTRQVACLAGDPRTTQLRQCLTLIHVRTTHSMRRQREASPDDAVQRHQSPKAPGLTRAPTWQIVKRREVNRRRVMAAGERPRVVLDALQGVRRIQFVDKAHLAVEHAMGVCD